MISFRNGPASGQILTLHRAPFLLRVTQEGKSFDALDQLEDEPRAEEALHAYVLEDGPTAAFVRCSKPGRSGLVLIAAYRVVPTQPRDKDMRTRAAWVAWCEAHAPGLGYVKPEAAP